MTVLGLLQGDQTNSGKSLNLIRCYATAGFGIFKGGNASFRITENELGEISKVSFGILKLGDASFWKTKKMSRVS